MRVRSGVVVYRSMIPAGRSSSINPAVAQARMMAALQSGQIIMHRYCVHFQPGGLEMNSVINEDKMNALLGRIVVDFGAVSMAPLVLIGDQLGLYRALAEGGALTSAQLAERTETHERYVREWLNAQAASGYVEYLADSGHYRMTPEQAAALADEDSPVFVVGAFQVALAAGRSADRLAKAFRTGQGIGWHEHDHSLFHGIERFFRSSYIGHLVNDWIPALSGVEEKLRAGAVVADIGCGHGAR